MNHNIPRLLQSPFNTATIAFKEAEGDQYEWVVEFTCNHGSPISPIGNFVGLNLYSRQISASNLNEMIAAVKFLGLSWVMEEEFHVVPHNSSCKYNTTGTQ